MMADFFISSAFSHLRVPVLLCYLHPMGQTVSVRLFTACEAGQSQRIGSSRDTSRCSPQLSYFLRKARPFVVDI